MKKSGRWFLDNIGIILTVVAVGLLVLAANIDSPSGWLLVPAWSMLGFRVWLWFEENKQNQQKSGPFVLMVIPLFIAASASQRFQVDIIKVLECPTFENLWKLTTGSPFLFLVACYFAISLVFTKGKLDYMESHYENLNKRRLEEIALYKSELKRLQEKLLDDKKSSNN